jgi:hypothetical protein
MAHLVIETGRVGWGRVKGLISYWCFGLIRFAAGRGTLADRLKAAADEKRRQR